MFFNKYIKRNLRYKHIIKTINSLTEINLDNFEQLKTFYIRMAPLITNMEEYHVDIMNFNIKQKTVLVKKLLEIMVKYNKIMVPFLNNIQILLNNTNISDNTKLEIIEYAKSNAELSKTILKALDGWVVENL